MSGWRGDAAEAKIVEEEVSGPSREEGLKKRAQRGKSQGIWTTISMQPERKEESEYIPYAVCKRKCTLNFRAYFSHVALEMRALFESSLSVKTLSKCR
jgi:hypothetical protein